MAKRKVLMLVCTVLLQSSVYLYLDRVLFAPATAYEVSSAVETIKEGDSGKVFFSRTRTYKAEIKKDRVEISAVDSKDPLRVIPLGAKKVSFFRWLNDRDMALMGTHEDVGSSADPGRVFLTQLIPSGGVHEMTETISQLPRGSKITGVACSTATNVIYIQVQISSLTEQAQVYRTDANHELKRLNLNSTRIGRMAVMFDRDWLIYDDLSKTTVVARHEDGTWETISPPGGKYRLVGVDTEDTIYIAGLNAEGLAVTILAGKAQGGFKEERKLPGPVDTRNLTLKELGKSSR